jgi:ankyrin repeat protein
MKHIKEYEAMLREKDNDYDMYTALMSAIRRYIINERIEDEQVVADLLENGAPANGAGEEWMQPIFLAAGAGLNRIIELLLKHGAKINSIDKWSNTPLHEAAANDRYDCCEFLIMNGATIDAQNDSKETPLFVAVDRNRVDSIKSLLKYGADVDKPNMVNDTPLMTAIWDDRYEVAKLLISRGANIELVNIGGDTALFYAVRRNNDDIVRLLVERNANLTYDWASPSPLGLALKRGYLSIARILIEGGVDPLEEFKTASDVVNFFGEDAEWLAKHLPPGPERQLLSKKGKTKNLFGL